MIRRPQRRRLRGKVVVITGASSGIGRAAALAFARHGSNVVVAARRAQLLARVADECRDAGADALAVQTDVTIPDQVDRLARAAVDRFGRIDIWVSNAAVLMMGRFEDAPPEAFRRVVETNLFGRVYAARAALRAFRICGGGTLIDVSSVLGILAQPYASAYVAAKFAVRGFVQTLRTELFDSPNIHVCSVLPAPIDTPIYQRAANFTGHEIRSMWPVYDPQAVVEAILSQALRPRRQVIAGGFGRLLVGLHAVSPTLTAHLGRRAVDLVQLGRGQASDTYGNLFESGPGPGHIGGGWRSRYRKTIPLVAMGALLVAAPILAAAVSWRLGAQRRTEKGGRRVHLR